ncbi:hypothetical protein R3I93_011892 [Phoxinus phoxinus]|uniref:Uncharacterized protein n=1 Tax=Phoxinus phoxinus TaxID=58324 RepID=A0AAN9CUQ5_9TELE
MFNVTLTILLRVLATVFIDGKETWRKLFTVGSVGELINSAKTERSQQVSIDRILRFDEDFQEFIDIDVNSELKELDKFQIFYTASTTQDPLDGRVESLLFHSTDVSRIVTTTGLLTLLEEKAPTILREHEDTKTLSISLRKLLVKVAVSDLVEKHGFYPSGTEKMALAKEIVSLFPSLRINVPFGENEGHEHFFDGPSHSGFIEMRLRNLRRKLQQSQRSYNLKRRLSTDQPSLPIVDEAVPTEWLTLIKRIRPSPENSSPIKTAIDQTFSYRRRWITEKSPTVGQIFKEYPRFLDILALLDIAFSKVTDGKEDMFIKKWEGTIIPKLKEIASFEKKTDIRHLLEKADNQQDDELCHTMLRILIHLLPPTASGRSIAGSKCCVNSALSYLLEVVPAGTIVTSLLREGMNGSLKSTQPQLVSIGSPGHEAQYVIVANNDSFAFPLDVENLTCAVDKLFKFYWLCNLQYPCQLSSVFSFFFEYVYDLPLSQSTCKRSKVMELIAKLQSRA